MNHEAFHFGRRETKAVNANVLIKCRHEKGMNYKQPPIAAKSAVEHGCSTHKFPFTIHSSILQMNDEAYR